MTTIQSSRSAGRSRVERWTPVLAVALLVLSSTALTAQATGTVGVVDAGRVFQESNYGVGLLEGLKQLREQKQAEGAAKQDGAKALQDRIAQSQLALSPEKLEELQKELEDDMIDLQRFEDDAGREIEKASGEAMNDFNLQIMPIIDSIGRERGFTLIFNKFEAGLLFASEQVDITEAVIARFNETKAGEASSTSPTSSEDVEDAPDAGDAGDTGK